MNIELLSVTPNAEELIESAARTCYKSNTNAVNRHKFLQGIVRRGHLSVTEHASATFRISDVSRALTHQLVRHRIASFSQESQRYVKSDKIKFVTPPCFEDNPRLKNIYTNAIQDAFHIYNMLLREGVKPEDARYVLPNAATTSIVMTANFREWLHFIKLRTDSHAQWEIRNLANDIKTVLTTIAPSIFMEE